MRQNATVGERTVFIAGAYEFVSDNGEQPNAKAWAPLVRAFERLRYSAGSLSPDEAKAMADHGVQPPANWLTLSDKDVQTTLLETPHGKLGVVFFPMLKNPKAQPSEDTLQKVDREVARLRSTVSLVVGVSPWGQESESYYLENAKTPPDVLLGSGPGVGFMARPEVSGRVLWMHTYNKGKAIYSLDVLQWPAAKGFKWEMGTSFTTQALILDTSYPADTEVDAVFTGIPDLTDTHENK